MKERGMIFNSEMVRAILEGRKTQTRRPVKPQPELTERSGFSWNGVVFGSGSDDRETNRNFAHVKCPFGKPGDRIWVRETFQGPLFDYEQMQSYLEDSSKFEKPEFCQYAADGKPAPEYYDADDNLHCGWRPSIHMPRWASRITLEITDVRVERLNNISYDDAISEGIKQEWTCIDPGLGSYAHKNDVQDDYETLWKSIYGTDSWQANPWVWVIEFKRVEGAAL